MEDQGKDFPRRLSPKIPLFSAHSEPIRRVMKVFLVTQQYVGTVVGGEGVHVIELSRELRKKNIDVTVLTLGIRNMPSFEEVHLEDPFEKDHDLRRMTVPTHRFFTTDSALVDSPYQGTHEQNIVRSKEFKFQVLGFLRGQPDQERSVVHLHGHYMVPSLAKELKAYTKLKVVATIHRAESIYEEQGLLSHPERIDYMQKKEIDAINFSDRVVVRSKFVKDFLSEVYQKRIKDNIGFLPSAVGMPFIHEPIPSAEELAVLKAKYSIKGDLILSLGIFEPLKGFEFSLQAIPLLAKKLARQAGRGKAEFTYIIAGLLTENHRWYLNKLQKIHRKIADPRVRNSVRFMLNIDQSVKKDLYHMATVFLYTPIAEPFGITLAEALTKNNIVVSSDVEGPRFVLDCHEPVKPPFTRCAHGLLVANDLTRRPEFIAEALFHALTNKESLKPMCERGCDYIVRNFSWNSLINEKISLYKSILK
jgi:glycosyltransferase involved in cell wall biosynthesis